MKKIRNTSRNNGLEKRINKFSDPKGNKNSRSIVVYPRQRKLKTTIKLILPNPTQRTKAITTRTHETGTNKKSTFALTSVLFIT